MYLISCFVSLLVTAIQKTRTNHAALLTLSNRISTLVAAIMDARDQIHSRINVFTDNDPRRLSLCNRLRQVSSHPGPIGQLLT